MSAASMVARCLARQQGEEARELPSELLSRGHEAMPWSPEFVPKSDQGRADVIPLEADEAIP